MAIIYFTRFPITHDKGGGARRMMQILELMKKVEPELEVVSSTRADWIPKKEMKKFKKDVQEKKYHSLFFTRSYIKKWAVDHQLFVFRLHEYSKRLIRLIEKQNKNYDLAIMDDPIYFAPLFKTLIKKNIPVVAASQNIESLAPGQVERKWAKKLFREELEILSQCRLIITISREEDVFLKNFGLTTRYLPYHPVEPIRKRLLDIREKRQHSRKDGILMIGNWKNMPTRQGMNDAVRFWRQNHLEHLAGKLIIGGFQCESYIECQSIPGTMEFHGTLSNEALDEFLCSVKACLCYQPNGSGALTRICEMLTAGVPVLANSHAARSYYNIPGVFEFPALENLSEALKQFGDAIPEVPLPLPPDTSLLISDIQRIVK
jgi:hypothetical protein